MKYKVYTRKIKLDVLNEYVVIKKLKTIDIKTKYQLSTRSLIYNWVKKYQKNNKLITIHTFQTNHQIDKVNIKDKNLKLENKKLKKSLLKEKIKNEFLRQKQFCDKELKNNQNILNSKLLKSKCFLIVDKYRNKNYGINDIISLLPISKVAYYKWIKNGKKKYQTKIDNELLKELNKIVVISNKDKIIKITSLEKVRLELKKNNTNLKCSKNSIMRLLEDNNIKLLTKPKKQRRAKSNTLKSNFQDLLKRNFTSNTYLEKVGIDGTWFKELIINNKKTKLLLEIATDMNSNAIVGWKINKSENAITILNVLNQVTKASRKEHKIFATFIQSDLGSGNTSKIVTNSFNKSKTLIHSKSLSGFKGNQVSECLNRWIKRDFKIMFGNKFNSIKHFTEALRKFINWWNNDRMILRLKMSPNQFVQIWRQESKLI
ncbi:IS3 family transposase [Spiroplasma ixodetis]|uniref:IS3 family transposase n=1 Tax=Spiroplasma ixodetis TaxID=2141 RepID=UPI0025768FD2|nr:IS3 family transposase [Spiroplasma ixodetis]WJG70995.1 transposase, Sixod2 group, IS3 family [Spiroplasma ixodetis Y32]